MDYQLALIDAATRARIYDLHRAAMLTRAPRLTRPRDRVTTTSLRNVIGDGLVRLGTIILGDAPIAAPDHAVANRQEPLYQSS